MLPLDLEHVRQNARSASTEDLLDRSTVFREQMEPEAVTVFEEELRQRGLSAEQIADHRERRVRAVAHRPDGTVARCSFCHRPAVAEGWGWHRLWGRIPTFPRYFYYCEEHRREDESVI
jgi:hypothetical protein